MKKQSLFNRAVKITGVSMLTFALYFNIGMDVEIGEFGTFSLKSVTFGDIAFAQESVEPIESDDQKIAKNCKFTGNMDDSCPDGVYTIARCREKSVVDTTPSTCGYNP